MKQLKKLILIMTLIFALSSGLFRFTVQADAIKTDLQTAYNNVNVAITNQDTSPVENPYYEVNSYQTFIDSINLLGGLVGIQAVIDDALAEQSDVDDLTTNINSALEGLTLDDTYNSVLAELNQAKALELSTYTPLSIIDYNNELTRIETILNTSDSGETTIQGLSSIISDANNLLILIADKTNLELLNNLLIKAYYEESQLYTKTSHDAFKVGCDGFGSYLYVNSVIQDDNATSDAVASLENTIQILLDQLVPIVDNSDVLAVYYDLIDLDISTYTENSQTSYLDELDRIYTIAIGNEFDTTAHQQVLLDLAVVEELLVELSDYSELQDLYDTISIYREEDYSSTSYGSFLITVQNTENTLANLNATQLDIDSAIETLQLAIDSLEKTIELIYIQEGETLDVTQHITLGDSSISSYIVEDTNILSVDSNGLVTGINYGQTVITVVLENGLEENIEISVLAGVTTPVYIMVFSMPVISLGLGALVIYTRKETWVNVLSKITEVFKKKDK